MFSSRYFYYLIFLNMLANIVVFVPRILIDERREGAILAMVIAIPLGLISGYLFAKCITKFPGKGLPEIFFESSLPNWFAKLLMIYLALIWFSAGIIALMAFTDITIRFINPDIGVGYTAILFLILVVSASILPSEKILYLLEIILVIILPLSLFLFLKAYINDTISWMDMFEAGTYVAYLPSWNALSAATYVFSGYINLVIFNRFFTKKIDTRPFWILIFVGVAVMITTFFIPIGYYGFDGVGEFNYPWLSTADAIRMEFAFVERVFFLFLLIYVAISLVNVIVHWHVGLKLLISIFPKKQYRSTWFRLDFIVLIFISIVHVIIQLNASEATLFKMSEWWLNLRMPSEYLGVALVILLVRRMKK